MSKKIIYFIIILKYRFFKMKYNDLLRNILKNIDENNNNWDKRLKNFINILILNNQNEEKLYTAKDLVIILNIDLLKLQDKNGLIKEYLGTLAGNSYSNDMGKESPTIAHQQHLLLIEPIINELMKNI